MFKDLYAPIPDVGRYLLRLQYDGPVQINRTTLDTLMLSHLQNVPFENIDIFDAHQPISLGIPSLFEKIVLRRRGGYCFELNGLFMALLTALGYSCYAVAARVLAGKDYLPPLAHRASVVTIDGERYFSDVGFGGLMADCSLKLDETSEQMTRQGVFRFASSGAESTLLQKTQTGDVPLISFADRPVDPVDFVTMNHYFSASPESYFKSRRMVHLLTQSGRVCLDNNLLKRAGEASVVLKTRKQIAEVLCETFGILIDEMCLQPNERIN